MKPLNNSSAKNSFDNALNISPRIEQISYLNKWTVGWGFTSLCDLKCSFCYSSKIRGNTENSETNIKLAKQFLRKNGNYISSINFGTGECFLSPSFPALVEHCNLLAPKAKLAVTTNGALADLSPASLKIVKNYIHECDISLDFVQKDKHDFWRGKKGTWARAIKAIETAIELGLHTSIVMIGTKQTLNKNNIQGLLNIAVTYNVAFRINLYMPTTGDYSFVPSIKSIFELFTMLNKWSSNICSSDRLFSIFLGNSKINNDLTKKLSCRIMPNGNVSSSTYLLKSPWIIDTDISNIKLNSLEKTTSFIKYANPPIPINCKRCSYYLQCQGGSVERRWLWYNSLEKPDPFCPKFHNLKNIDITSLASVKNNKKWFGPKIHFNYLPTIIALPPNFKNIK